MPEAKANPGITSEGSKPKTPVRAPAVKRGNPAPDPMIRPDAEVIVKQEEDAVKARHKPDDSKRVLPAVETREDPIKAELHRQWPLAEEFR